jgi:hypothetical protein
MNEDKLRDDYWAAWREAAKQYNELIENLEGLGEITAIEKVKQLDSSLEVLRRTEIMLVKHNISLNH